MAWIAVFSLQMGMFVCGVGIDVCHAADDAPAHIEFSPSQSDNDHQDQNAPVDQTCTAHAAHVFLGQPAFHQVQPVIGLASPALLASLKLPEILHLIEQPPRFLYS